LVLVALVVLKAHILVATEEAAGQPRALAVHEKVVLVEVVLVDILVTVVLVETMLQPEALEVGAQQGVVVAVPTLF
jgi:hypothetical protein